MGGDVRKEYLFSDISKDEFSILADYLQEKKELKVRVAKPISQVSHSSASVTRTVQ